MVKMRANINIDIIKFGPLFQQLMTSLYLSAVCSPDETSEEIYSFFQRRVCGHFHCSALFWDLPPIFSSPFDIPASSLPRSLLSSSFILLDELGIEFWNVMMIQSMTLNVGFGGIVVKFDSIHHGNAGRGFGLPKEDGTRKSMLVCMLAAMFLLDLRLLQTWVF